MSAIRLSTFSTSTYGPKLSPGKSAFSDQFKTEIGCSITKCGEDGFFFMEDRRNPVSWLNPCRTKACLCPSILRYISYGISRVRVWPYGIASQATKLMAHDRWADRNGDRIPGEFGRHGCRGPSGRRPFHPGFPARWAGLRNHGHAGLELDPIDPHSETRPATSRRSDKAATSFRSPCKRASSLAGRNLASRRNALLFMGELRQNAGERAVN